MSQVQRKPNTQYLMETNYSEFACLIGHEALHEGELRDPTDGYDFMGEDDRGLPIFFVCEEEEDSFLDELGPLEGIHLYGYPVLDACPHIYPHLPSLHQLARN